MAKVYETGKAPTKPLFGISRGALIPISRKLGLSSGASSQPKKEMSKANKEVLESFRLHRADEAKAALSGEQE
jgi:hypothetical protein